MQRQIRISDQRSEILDSLNHLKLTFFCLCALDFWLLQTALTLCGWSVDVVICSEKTAEIKKYRLIATSFHPVNRTWKACKIDKYVWCIWSGVLISNFDTQHRCALRKGIMQNFRSEQRKIWKILAIKNCILSSLWVYFILLSNP